MVRPFPAPRPSWPVAIVGLGVATFGFLVPLLVNVVSLDRLLGNDASLVLVAPVLALVAALAARRPLAGIAIAAAVTGTVAGLLLLSSSSVLAAMPSGDAIVPRDLIAATKDSQRRVLGVRETDLALLRRGGAAARAGRPLPAPEGGLLVPAKVGLGRGYDSPLRYEATEQDPKDRWEVALREQEATAAETRLRAETAYRDSAAAWIRRAGVSLATSLALAFVVALVALLSRALFGAAR